jgi:hypothetical protein
MFIEWPVGNHILYNLEQRLVIVSILRAERIPRKYHLKALKTQKLSFSSLNSRKSVADLRDNKTDFNDHM